MEINAFTQMLGRERASAILRTDQQDAAALAMEAAIRGGFKVIEFTLTIPGVYELIEDFAHRPDVVVGAGTVLDTQQAERAGTAGAAYLVSPVFDGEVIEAGKRMGVATMPGTHTATEMLAAHRAGATFCKLFPAPGGGPTYVQAMLGPMPFLKIVPTHGVDHHNAAEWISAGAFAVGFVATLFEPAWLATAQWEAVEARARDCLVAAQSST